jgi:hypothetical protein
MFLNACAATLYIWPIKGFPIVKFDDNDAFNYVVFSYYELRNEYGF